MRFRSGGGLGLAIMALAALAATPSTAVAERSERVEVQDVASAPPAYQARPAEQVYVISATGDMLHAGRTLAATRSTIDSVAAIHAVHATALADSVAVPRIERSGGVMSDVRPLSMRASTAGSRLERSRQSPQRPSPRTVSNPARSRTRSG